MAVPWLRKQLDRLRKISSDRAKVELAKNIAEIVIRAGADGSFKIRGEWDLIGDRFADHNSENMLSESGSKPLAKCDFAVGRPQYNARSGKSKPEWCGFRMAPGARTVPNVPRVFFNLRVVK
jgi:hypothetical protein